jgi:hypothetical protein
VDRSRRGQGEGRSGRGPAGHVWRKYTRLRNMISSWKDAHVYTCCIATSVPVQQVGSDSCESLNRMTQWSPYMIFCTYFLLHVCAHVHMIALAVRHCHLVPVKSCLPVLRTSGLRLSRLLDALALRGRACVLCNISDAASCRSQAGQRGCAAERR